MCLVRVAGREETAARTLLPRGKSIARTLSYPDVSHHDVYERVANHGKKRAKCDAITIVSILTTKRPGDGGFHGRSKHLPGPAYSI